MFNLVTGKPIKPTSLLLMLMTMLWLVIPTQANAQEFSASILGDYSNVTVMEVSGNYDAWNTDGSENLAARKAVAQEFFRTHKDEYDFLVIFSNFDYQMIEDDATAFYRPVRNDIKGIGISEFIDQSHAYGSNRKLQGTIDMGNITKYVTDPIDPKFNQTLSTLSHEMQHRWGAYAKFKDASGAESSALLGKNGGHWSFLLDSGGSLMYGNKWRDNGDNTFTSLAPRSELKYYSPVDLYLMGMIGPEQVPPMLLIDNPAIDPKRLPEAGVTITGTARTVTIDDIIAAMGERVPSAATSQKSFKTAFIFLARPGTFTGQEIYGIENIRNGAVTRFSVLTDGRSIMEVASTPKPDVPVNPGILPPSTTPRQQASIDAGVAWLLTNQRNDGSWMDLAQTMERDTAEAVTVLKQFPAAQTNVQAGLLWLGSSQTLNTDYLCRKIEAAVNAGANVSAFAGDLLGRQNVDGGWGSERTYASNAADTALVLRVLSIAGAGNQQAISRAIQYLLSAQKPDGGWTGNGESTIQATASALSALNRYRTSYPTGDAISRGTAWLISKQMNGAFGPVSGQEPTVYDTALAVLVLRELDAATSITNPAVGFLESRQDVNGSWNSSVFETALAMKAILKGNVDPDLVVRSSDITFTPDRISALPADVVITVAVSNNGLTIVPATKVVLYDGVIADASKVGEKTIAVPGKSAANVTFSSAIADGNEHTFIAVVDPENLVKESNENNNRAGRSLQVQTTFDLEVSSGDVIVSPATASLLQDVTITAKISNKGTMTGYSVPVKFVVTTPGGPVEVAMISADIPANGSVTRSVTWRANRSGANMPVSVQLDPMNDIAELDEANNAASAVLTVSEDPRANVTMTYQDIVISPSPASEGRSAAITAMVKNEGRSSSGDMVVNVYRGIPGSPGGASLIGSVPVASLAAGASAPLSLTWDPITISGSGIVVFLHAVTDPAYPELDLEDNKAFVTIDIHSLPDLAISANAVSVQPAFPKEGDLVKIAATVQNSGDQPAQNVLVRLMEGGTTVGFDQTVTMLAGHSTATVSFSYGTAVGKGAHEIAVIVDPENTISEKSKANNRATRTFGVQDADLWVTERFFSPNGDGVKDATELFFRLPSPQTITIEATNRKGETVWTYQGTELQSISAGSVRWDGLTGSEKIAEDGIYLLKVLNAEKAVLGSVSVVLDNNRSPLAEAVGTPYLLNNLLTCPLPDVWDWQWYPDERGIVFALTDDWRNTTGYTPGLYTATPDGDTVIRLIPGDWTPRQYNGTDINYTIETYAVSPTSDKVAFILNVYDGRLGIPQKSQLWTVDSDGSHLNLLVSRDLTKEYAPLRSLKWAPDGDRLLFEMLRLDSNLGAYVYDYWMQPLSGIGLFKFDTSLSWANISEVQWSPSGNRIVYPVQRYDGTGNGQTVIRMYDAQAGVSDIKIVSDYVDGIAWIDDAKILFSEFAGDRTTNRTSLYVLDAQSADNHRLIAYDIADGWFSLSPGGSFAFITNENGSQVLSMSDASGSIRVIDRITPEDPKCTAHIGGVIWSPDGGSIAYRTSITWEIPDYAIYQCVDPEFIVWDKATGGKRLLSGLSADLGLSGWMSDGRTIVAASQWGSVDDLLFVNATTGEVSAALAEGFSYGISPREHYVTYRRYTDETTACAGTSSTDIGAISSLLNLTADLRIVRGKSFIALKGIAADLNFEGYRLDYADSLEPTAWQPVVPPSDSPVMNGAFITWVPPHAGTFLVRLTVWDKAGNTAVDRKRVSWGQASSISNLALSTKLISPADRNGSLDSVELRYRVNEPVHLEFNVLDKDGRIVRTYLKDPIAPGDDLMSWDGQDEQRSFVPDGEYTIKVFDLLFPVTVDNTAPGASVRFGQIMQDSTSSSVMAAVYGRAADSHIKGWVLEYSSDSDPLAWIEYLRGEKPLGRADGPDEDIVNLNVFGAIPLMGRQFRLTVEDLAGNRSIAVSDRLEEQVVMNKYDGVQLRREGDRLSLITGKYPEIMPGSHTFEAFSTLRQPVASWTVQYSQDYSETTDEQGRPKGTWSNWKDIAVNDAPTGGIVSLQWQAPALDISKPAAVRVRAVDILNRTHISEALVAQQAFHIEAVCAPDASVRAFVVRNYVFTSDINQLRIQIAAQPTLTGIPSQGIALNWKAMPFSLVPHGAMIDSLPASGSELTRNEFVVYIPADRFISGSLYSIRLVGATDQGEQISKAAVVQRDDDPFANDYELRLDVLPVEASCNMASSGSNWIGLQVYHKGLNRVMNPAELPPAGAVFLTTSYVLDGPAGSTLLGEFAFDQHNLGNVTVEASLLPAGRYTVRALLNYRTGCGVAHDKYAVNEVYSDRAIPTTSIAVPADGSTVCAVQYPRKDGTTWYGVPLDASINDDAGILRYKFSYASGAEPADWLYKKAETFDDKKGAIAIEETDVRLPSKHETRPWYVSGITGTNFSLRLEAVDVAGNKTCSTTNFTITDRVTVSGPTVDKPLFSPKVGEGRVRINFAVEDIATAAVTIHRKTDDSYDPAPVRTLTAPKSYPAGQGVEFWDGKNDNAEIVEGKFVVVVTAGDPCGHRAVASRDVEVDATPPIASIIYPRPGDAFGTIVEVTGTASDLHFQSYKLEASLGSAPTPTAVWTELKTGANPVSSSILGTWNNFGIVDDWMLRLTVVDAVGHSSVSSLLLTIEERTGLISDLSAKPGLISPNHDGKADGTVIGYGLTSAASVLIEISRAGTIVNRYTTNALSAGAYSYEWQGTTNAEVDVPDDTYTVRLTATQGSVIDTQSVTVLVDTTKPVVEITQPSDNAYLALRDVSVRGKITDQNIAEYAISHTGANGAIQIDNGSQSRTDYLFGTLNDLPEGAYTIHVKAKDLGENEFSTNIPFTIDRTPPAVKLDTPKDGGVYGTVVTASSGTYLSSQQTASITFTGGIVEQNLAAFSLRYGSGENPSAWTDLVTGTTITALPTTYSWNVGAIPDGLYTLSLQATDKAGLKGEAKVRITVDNTPPTVAITSPLDGAYVKGAIEVTGAAADQNLDRYTVEVSEGQCASAFRWTAIKKGSAPVSGGSLASWQALSADGEYCIRVAAVDKIGSSADAKVQVKVDTKPPVAPVLAGALENGTTANLSWQGVPDPDLAGYNLYRGGMKANDAVLAATTYEDPNLAEGLHVYTVKAIDRAGWESPASNDIRLRVDLTGPDAKILSPVNGANIGDLVDIKGRAYSSEDFKVYRVSIGQGAVPTAWNVIRTSSLPTSYGVLAQIDALGLAENQVYTVKLEAEDLAGNITSDRISITIDNTPPNVPEFASTVVDGSSVTLQWSDSPEVDLAGYLLFVNERLVNASSNMHQMDMRPYALPCPSYYHYDMPDGTFNYRVAALDKAGNMSALSSAVTVTIDTRAPQIEIVEPVAVIVNNQKMASIGGATVIRAESPDLDIDAVTFYYSVSGTNSWYSFGESRQAPYEAVFTPAAIGTTYDLKVEATDRHLPQPNRGVSPAIAVLFKDLTPPPVPSGLAATVNAGTVTLVWSVATDTDTMRYLLYRTNADYRELIMTGQLLKETTTYQETINIDGMFAYDITAVDAAGNESGPSARVPAQIYAPVIDPIGTVTTRSTVTITGSNAAPLASLRFDIMSQAGPLQVARTADQAGRFTATIDLSAGSNAITATATDGTGNVSRTSNLVSIEYNAIPAAPALQTPSVQGSSVTLAWNGSYETDVTGYNVYRKSGENWVRLTAYPTIDRTWVDGGLRNGTYQYRVSAVDALSESPLSDPVTAVVEVAVLNPPVMVSATALPDGKADVVWLHAAGNAAGFHLYRGTAEGGPFSRITAGLLSATSFQDGGLTHGATYYYVSTAADPVGNESGYSMPPASVVAIDATSPEKPLITAPTTSLSPIIVTMPTVTVAGTAEPGTTVELFRNGLSMGTVQATGGNGLRSFQIDGYVNGASISPDGSKLSYTTSNGQVQILDLASSNVAELTPQGSYPSWSPDGGRIVFVSSVNYPPQIIIHDVAANADVPLSGELPDYIYPPFSWSADGTKFVFAGYSHGQGVAIWLKDLITGDLTPVVVKDSIYEPVLSPEGERLAYFQNGSLFVLDLRTGQESSVGPATDGWSLSWSPDGSRLAFIETSGGGNALYVAVPGTGARTLLAESAGSLYWTAWFPDGQQIAYAEWDSLTGLSSVKITMADGSSVQNPVEEGITDIAYLGVTRDGQVSYVHSNADTMQSLLKVVSSGGRFVFVAASLDPGENLFSATVADSSGNVSPPSDSISVTRDLSQHPDLAVATDDIALYPAAPLAGEQAAMSVAVWNRGQSVSSVADVSVYVWNETGFLDLLAQGSVPSLEPGAVHLVSGLWNSTGRLGANRIVVVVDSEQLVVESNETNNMALLDFFVADREGIVLSTTLDASQYASDSAVNATVSIRNSGAPREGVLSVTIEDENGSVAAVLTERALSAAYASRQELAFVWNTGSTFAGNYRVHAVLSDPNGSPVEHATAFSIIPDMRLDRAITTDKASYGAGERVGVIATLNNLGKNRIIPLIVTRVTITSETGAVLFSEERNTADVLPGASIGLSSLWNAGIAPAGSYTASLETIVDGIALPIKSARFIIRGAAVVTGMLTVSPDPVPFGMAFRAVYSLQNSGNAGIGPATARILIIYPETQAVLGSYESQAVLASSGSITGQADFTGLTNKLAAYTAVLQYVTSDGAIMLASAPVTIKDMTAPTMTVLSPVSGFDQASTVSFLVAAADDASGVERIEYARDGGSWSMLPVVDPARGRFGTTWEPTMADNGPHSVSFIAVDRAGNRSEPATISYNVQINRAPTTPSPAQPPTGSDVLTQRPELSVSNASDPNGDVLTYSFEVFSDSSLTAHVVSSGPVPAGPGVTVWQVTADLTENAVYYWHARAHDGQLAGPWMDAVSFRVNAVNDLPTAPALSKPENQTEVDTLTPVLEVMNATDPDSMGLTYNFQVALDPDFVTIVTSTTGVFAGQQTTAWTLSHGLMENTTYYWRAQADDWLEPGPWSSPYSFLVNTHNDAPSLPAIASPENGMRVLSTTVDIALVNSIDPDSTDIRYIVELDTSPAFDSPGIIRSPELPQGQGSTLWHVEGLSDNTEYYCRAKASDGQAESGWSQNMHSFFVNTANDAPTKPVLLDPSNGSGVGVFSPALTVRNASDIDRDMLVYEYEIYEDAAMTTRVDSAPAVPETPLQTSWTVAVALQENHTYFWRARAKDANLASEWTDLFSFTVNTGDDAPAPPTVVAPSEGSSVDTSMPTLTVLNAIDPDSSGLTYAFEVYSGTILVWSATGTAEGSSGSTSVTLPVALDNNTVYRWRCRAHDGQIDGDWSAMTSFTVHLAQAGITVDIEVEPETLSQKSKGNWVMVEIELPHGYAASDVDISSIRLEGTVPAVVWPHERKKRHHPHGCDDDHREHDHGELKVKFRRDDVIAVLPAGARVPVHVTGTVNGTPFEGVDFIRVIH